MIKGEKKQIPALPVFLSCGLLLRHPTARCPHNIARGPGLSPELAQPPPAGGI